MSIVTHSELEKFVRTYLNTFSNLTSKLSESQKHLLLPRYLGKKCNLTATISKIKGASISFDVTKNKESLTFQDTKKSIEDEVLPILAEQGNVFFVLDGKNQVLENMNLITKEFCDKHEDLIVNLTRSTNFIMSGAEKFVDVVSGDLKLVDCTLAFCKNGEDVLDRIDCLWLFGSNQFSSFSESRAKYLATTEYEKLASILVNRIPIQTLVGTLSRFKELIDNKNSTEPNMQNFFEKNWMFLEISAKRVFPKFNMGGEKIPDFIIETSDYRYVLVEIESPNVNLYTSETPPKQSRKLREADSQIKSYLSYARENILFLRRKLPFLSAEKTEGLIVIGRSGMLSLEQKKRLEQDRAFGKDYDIVTYDELFENVRGFLENLGFRYSHS
jgi:hypothetical protein